MSDALFSPCVKVQCFFVAYIVRVIPDGVRFDGASVDCVILWNFHQAVRAEAIVIALKHGWCFMD